MDNVSTTNETTGKLNNLNAALEENRKQSERLKILSDQIYKEVEDNKAERLEIEKNLDIVYSIIQQQK